MGERTTPGCLERSSVAGAAGPAGGAAAAGVVAGAATCATVVWRATRTRSPFCSTSISLSPVSSSNAASSWISSRSTETLLLCTGLFGSCMAASALDRRADHRGKPDDRQPITLDAEPADDGSGAARHIGMMAEALPRVNIAEDRK